MKFTIVYKKSAEKELLTLPVLYAIKVREAINNLVNNPRPVGCKKLKCSAKEYRIRINDYRVIYTIENNILIITVIKIAHRKNIYR